MTSLEGSNLASVILGRDIWELWTWDIVKLDKNALCCLGRRRLPIAISAGSDSSLIRENLFSH
jgi:hypothetical protein